MKKILLFTIMALFLINIVGCTSDVKTKDDGIVAEDKNSDEKESVETEKEDIKESVSELKEIVVAVPPAPPSIPVLKMIEDKALGEDIDIKLDVWTEPESLIAMVQDKKHDMFAFPLTVASKLYNKGIDIRLMNVNTWGVTYFVTSDPDFKEWSDLKDKTIYVPLQSSPPDALTQYFLSEANLKVGEDVEVVYASMIEIATMLVEGKVQYATLIEPQVTRAIMNNNNLRVALSFEEEWQRTTNTNTKIPNAGWGTTQSFLDQHPDLVKKFDDEYEKACAWINENPAEAGKLAEKHLGLKAGLIEKAIPKMGLEYKSAEDAKEELSMFYKLLHDFDPSMIGGKIADETLYYKK